MPLPETKSARKTASDNQTDPRGQTKPRSVVDKNPVFEGHHKTARVYLVRRVLVLAAVCIALLTAAFCVDRIASIDKVGRRVEVAGIDVAGLSSQDATTELRARAAKLTSMPIEVRAENKTFELAPTQIDAKIDVGLTVDAALAARSSWNPIAWLKSFFQTIRLDFSAVAISQEKVDALLQPAFESVKIAPVDATFEIVDDGQRVHVIPAQNGRGLDIGKAMDDMRSAVLAHPSTRGRTVVVPLAEIPPNVTTADAEAMGITEPLATFTTKFPSGEERVKNIRRISELISGTLIAPGGRFSVNEKVGKRTKDKGFVSAPVIYDGEYADDVGGGVSQYATTTFNALWFAGVPIKEYKAHSLYISRYPLGREATLSYPHPDLVFVNDYSSHMLIKSWVGDSSVTVALYGAKDGREVLSETSERHTPTTPKLVCRLDTALGPGSQKTEQSPSGGFSVDVIRKIKRPDGKVTEQKITTVYEAKNKIVRYNPAAPTPSTTAPQASPSPPTTPPTTPPASGPCPAEDGAEV